MKKRLLVLSLISFLALMNLAAAAIQISSPEFGVAQEKTFDITLTTTAPASCRYSTPFEKSFDEMSSFETTGTNAHTLTGFEAPSFGTEYDFFVNCSLGSGNYEAAKLALSADNTNPSISSAKAEPDKVVQTPLETKLTVATSEKTSCKYDETEEEYDAMANLLGGSDSEKQNYKSAHEKLLAGLSDDKDYSINIMCRELSGRRTGLSKISFKVNTSAEPEIINFTPGHGSYSSDNAVVVSITTNKNSVCKYGEESPTQESGTFNAEGTSHKDTIALAEGTYTYNFKCVLEGPKELTAQTTFTIDETAPAMLFVKDAQGLKDAPEQRTYYTDRLKAEWKAEDNESGIKQYNYSIISGSKTVVNWTATTSDEVALRELRLEDGKKYFFRVKAQNNAGLWSEEKESGGVTVDVSLNLEQACSNNAKDGDETDMDCGGSCKKCTLEKECRANSDCSSGYCPQGKCAAGSCDDGVSNQDETDVDCGGSCKPCLTGDKCRENNDCESGICTDGTCVSRGPCYNGVLDSTETDTDCGGICAEFKNKRCNLNEKCKADTDCKTSTCGVDGKCAPRNDADRDGVLGSNDNCPESYNPEQEDIDNDGLGDKCDDDSDNDGMTDEWEKRYGLNVLVNDAELDNDGDTLTNLKEFQLGTNPLLKDTDGDGYNDAEEAAKGTNPLDAKSKPKGSRILTLLLWLLILLAMAASVGYFYYRKLASPARETKKGLERRKKEEASVSVLPPQRIAEPERKYRPAPIYRQAPMPPRRKPDFDEIRKAAARLSGEEVFERLRRHTRRK